MPAIKFEINEKGRGAFFFEGDGKRLGEMIISISGEVLIVYHTEVEPGNGRKGNSKEVIKRNG